MVAGRWAQAIIARYTQRFWIALALNRQWRQSRREETASSSTLLPQMFAPSYFTYAPQLRLTLLMHTVGESSAAGIGRTAPSAPWQVIRQPAGVAKIQTLLQRVYQTEQVEKNVPQALTQQLMVRHQRVETLTSLGNSTQQPSSVGMLAAAKAGPNTPWSPPSAPPVRRVVHKAAAPPANPAGAVPTTPLPGFAESSRAVQRMPMQTSMANGNPLDINRLTDQVMQQIDRRMLAHRERTGRV